MSTTSHYGFLTGNLTLPNCGGTQINVVPPPLPDQYFNYDIGLKFYGECFECLGDDSAPYFLHCTDLVTNLYFLTTHCHYTHFPRALTLEASYTATTWHHSLTSHCVCSLDELESTLATLSITLADGLFGGTWAIETIRYLLHLWHTLRDQIAHYITSKSNHCHYQSMGRDGQVGHTYTGKIANRSHRHTINP